jgi:lactoylglutathione lyase
MCFSVPSTTTYIEKLIKKDISYYNAQGEKSRITTRIDGVKQVWIQDPDGYYIEINDARN